MSSATMCDGPDCNTWTRTLLDGWVKVLELPCIIEHEYTLHFCCWDCVLRHAATKEPTTVKEVNR